MIEEYINQFNISDDERIIKLQQFAKENHIPIMDGISLSFLLQLLRIHKPKTIVEIGSAIGYSAIRMALTATQAHIYTFEKDEVRVKLARENISEFNLNDQITLYEGDARELISQIPENVEVDFLFIDAAKGRNKEFFEIFAPLVSKDGVIITDNVLLKGSVLKERKDFTKRKYPMIRRLKEFNQWLMSHPKYDTVMLPIGDGILVTTLKEEHRV